MFTQEKISSTENKAEWIPSYPLSQMNTCLYLFSSGIFNFFKKLYHLRCKLKPWSWQLSGTYFVVFARHAVYNVTFVLPNYNLHQMVWNCCYLAKSDIFEIYLCWQHGAIAVHAFGGWIFGSLPNAKDAVILSPDRSPACTWATLGKTWTWVLTAEYVRLPL